MVAASAIHPAPTSGQPSPIAGFWRRLDAFAIDAVILCLPALLLGLAFFDWAESLGDAGRLLGFAATLLYFGLLNSRLGGGQTLGKRLLGIRVVGRGGQLLSPARVSARFLVLAIPYFLNDLWFDVDAATMGPGLYLLSMLLSFVVFGWGGAIIYLFVFNRRTRQSLHDLAVGSFVVRSAPLTAPIRLSVPRLHLVITGCWLALSLVAPAVTVFLVQQADLAATLQSLADLRTVLKAQPGVRQAQVTVGRNVTPATETDFLQVEVTASPGQADLDALVLRIADAVLAHDPNLLGQEVLIVRAQRRFDLGIVGWSYAHRDAHNAAAWRGRLRQRDPTSGS